MLRRCRWLPKGSDFAAGGLVVLMDVDAGQWLRGGFTWPVRRPARRTSRSLTSSARSRSLRCPLRSTTRRSHAIDAPSKQCATHHRRKPRSQPSRSSNWHHATPSHARTDRLRGTRRASAESSTVRSFSLPLRLQKNAKQESRAGDAENSNCCQSSRGNRPGRAPQSRASSHRREARRGPRAGPTL
ncbi:hypothetical protein BOMU111920_23205 [Bordetella muralis]